MAFQPDLEGAILAALDGSPAHGYEIGRRIRERSQRTIAPGEGRLYPALHGLEKSGFLRSIWEPQEGKPSRKVYALTEEGTAELQSRRDAWSSFRAAVDALMHPRRPEAGNA
ncbi:PadR family transcriptional regulator [bacterium]|nr:MAG: PadR family transcriptional regulator [bacterium]